jgi:histidinol-phosphatase
VVATGETAGDRVGESTGPTAGAADLGADLELALELADLADALTMPHFGAAGLRVETKADCTPVTEVDRGVERAVRKRLAADRPADAVLGEEYGAGAVGPAGRRWVLDPLDGTKNYVRGVPVWATLIALEQAGRPVVGVVSAPALGRRWWASAGGGAYAVGRAGPLRVSAVARLEEAFLSYDTLTGFDARGLGERAVALERRCARTRGFGDFWSHVLVAEGAVDVAVEPEVEVWDLAPLQVIVEEAGGRFTDLAGRAWTGGGSAVSTNGLLHDDVLAALGG